ncbi:MAG: hypothetical protein HUJ56_13350, partial [Erysipelotrichaceae bacterium]|nr:hypothetical protein [Erysipelotrichaceae bacterium]
MKKTLSMILSFVLAWGCSIFLGMSMPDITIEESNEKVEASLTAGIITATTPKLNNETIDTPIEDNNITVSAAAEETIFYELPQNSGFKSYMPYTAITAKSSPQYKLQEISYTAPYGLRKYDNRYCVAIGTAFGAPVGQYINLYLDNDVKIECIVGDIKADKHTQKNNMITSANGCCSEFLIDPAFLVEDIKTSGDISSISELWDSPVVVIEVLDINALKDEEKHVIVAIAPS